MRWATALMISGVRILLFLRVTSLALLVGMELIDESVTNVPFGID